MWYDMDGNVLSDMDAVEALLRDIGARRVALTDFDGRAEVPTVLLVLDHNWEPHGAPLIFETMTFVDGHGDISCARTPTRVAALAAHDQACADVRDMLARFDAETAAMGVTTEQPAQ
jgi:hypothetical protein